MYSGTRPRSSLFVRLSLCIISTRYYEILIVLCSLLLPVVVVVVVVVVVDFHHSMTERCR